MAGMYVIVRSNNVNNLPVQELGLDTAMNVRFLFMIIVLTLFVLFSLIVF